MEEGHIRSDQSRTVSESNYDCEITVNDSHFLLLDLILAADKGRVLGERDLSQGSSYLS